MLNITDFVFNAFKPPLKDAAQRVRMSAASHGHGWLILGKGGDGE